MQIKVTACYVCLLFQWTLIQAWYRNWVLKQNRKLNGANCRLLHAIKKNQVKIGVKVSQDTAQEFCKRGKLTKSIGKNFPKELVRQGVSRGLNHIQAGRIQTLLLDGHMRKGNFLPRPVEKLMGQCLHPYARPSRLYQRREPKKKRQVGQLRPRTTPNPFAIRQVASLSLNTTYEFPRFTAAASTWLSCYRSYRRLLSILAFLLLPAGSAHGPGPGPAALHCTGLARPAAVDDSEQNQQRSSGQSWRCLATSETGARSRSRSPTVDSTMNRCADQTQLLLPCSSECTPRPLCRHRVPQSRLLKNEKAGSRLSVVEQVLLL